jgi:hypothetical protein
VIDEVGVGDFSQSLDLYAWLQNSQASTVAFGIWPLGQFMQLRGACPFLKLFHQLLSAPHFSLVADRNFFVACEWQIEN